MSTKTELSQIFVIFDEILIELLFENNESIQTNDSIF
jgi:hypothetical protein